MIKWWTGGGQPRSAGVWWGSWQVLDVKREKSENGRWNNINIAGRVRVKLRDAEECFCQKKEDESSIASMVSDKRHYDPC